MMVLEWLTFVGHPVYAQNDYHRLCLAVFNVIELSVMLAGLRDSNYVRFFLNVSFALCLSLLRR